ncbi:T7SS effector LXG polymorphic toxin [Bacillus mojavensis]|uniref:T7SS effector LXG polymorphic toxin n=1 Tax=Bacillus mojavensis TaxID=72360 RepID=UPI00398A94D6
MQEKKKPDGQSQEAFNAGADLDDSEFSGKGANNINPFYKDYASVADNSIDLIAIKIAFLINISMFFRGRQLICAYIEESSLEHKLITLTQNQNPLCLNRRKPYIKDILSAINDILPLDLLSSWKSNPPDYSLWIRSFL